MTVLVAGATGNVGRPLVDHLLAAGHPVRALTRDPARAGLPPAAEVVADLRFTEMSRDEVVARWREQGYGADDTAFFLQMRTDPPAAGYTVLPTVEQVTGRPARTFRQWWVTENAAAFGGSTGR